MANCFELGYRGRPPKFKDPNDLKTKLVEYFEYCEQNKEPLTITGMALFLGFSSRQSLFDYEQNEKFTYIIKRARMVVERGYEVMLHTNKGCAGAIFALKNMNWTDTQTNVHEFHGSPFAADFTITYRNGDSIKQSAKG